MQTTTETTSLTTKLERVGTLLRTVGWFGFWLDLGLAAAAHLVGTFTSASLFEWMHRQ